jgi:hypothetical protein
MTPEQQRRRKTDWNRKTIIEVATIIVLGISIASAASSYFSTRWATHSEVTDAVKPVVDTLRVMRSDIVPRLNRVEQRQDAAESLHQLLVPLARYQCIMAERDRSKSLAEAAGLPCNSLLGRVR